MSKTIAIQHLSLFIWAQEPSFDWARKPTNYIKLRMTVKNKLHYERITAKNELHEFPSTASRVRLSSRLRLRATSRSVNCINVKAVRISMSDDSIVICKN